MMLKNFSQNGWLILASDQHDDGYVGHVIPDLLQNPQASSAWGDVAAICPWQVYLAFGNKQILKNQYQSMKKWIDYITSTTTQNISGQEEHITVTGLVLMHHLAAIRVQAMKTLSPLPSTLIRQAL